MARQVMWGEWDGIMVVVFECLIGRFVANPTLPPGAATTALGASSLSLCAKVALPHEVGSLLMLQRDRESRRIVHRAKQIHMAEVPTFDERWHAYADDDMADPVETCRRLRSFVSDREVLEIHDASLLVRWLDVDVTALEGRLDRLLAFRSVVVTPAA